MNHSFANIRAKVNRLNRRTWCTTKLPERLADHIDIYIDMLCDRLKVLSLPVKKTATAGWCTVVRPILFALSPPNWGSFE
ncbi:MAG: hypothetical protein AB8B79_20815 [Granulosicoccus sp.]